MGRAEPKEVSEILKNSKEYAENRKLHKEGCLCEVGMEVQDSTEVMSISSASKDGRNDKLQDTGSLLEEILHNSKCIYKGYWKYKRATPGDTCINSYNDVYFTLYNTTHIITSML